MNSQAQSSIDEAIDMMQKRQLTDQFEESQRKHGLISNSQQRFQNLLEKQRPPLTTEVALKELTNKMEREKQYGGNVEELAGGK